jgi:hypothetical protein
MHLMNGGISGYDTQKSIVDLFENKKIIDELIDMLVLFVL